MTFFCSGSTSFKRSAFVPRIRIGTGDNRINFLKGGLRVSSDRCYPN
jgi:hypothetical protein